MSLNAWGGAVFDQLQAWLPTCGADVLCLQEVTHTAGLDGWTHFSDGERALPQRADLFADVQRVMPAMASTYAPADAGPVRAPGGRVHHQQFGVATFVERSIHVVEHRTAFIHGSYVDHAEWTTSDRPRIALSVRVVDPSSDRRVSIIQLHGLRDPAGKADTPARRRQAERIAAFVDDAAETGDLVVVCGDFNLLPDSTTFERLRRVGLTELVGTADTRTSLYAKPVRHANYMLISDPQAVVRLDVLATPEVSDHRPIVLDIAAGELGNALSPR
ncbi:MAG: endonuclease/exonuclease/phosphatase family protein [Actinomycetota bacterium]